MGTQKGTVPAKWIKRIDDACILDCLQGRERDYDNSARIALVDRGPEDSAIMQALEHIRALEDFDRRIHAFGDLTRALRPFRERYEARLKKHDRLRNHVRRKPGKPPDRIANMTIAAAEAHNAGVPAEALADHVMRLARSRVPY